MALIVSRLSLKSPIATNLEGVCVQSVSSDISKVSQICQGTEGGM